jgi:hypothetical protein
MIKFIYFYQLKLLEQVCEKSICTLTLSKEKLRNYAWTSWLIKYLRKENLSDVGHFNMSSHVWQLMAKYMDNNKKKKKKMPIFTKNNALTKYFIGCFDSIYNFWSSRL